MKSEPLVSVVTPVYNGATYLAECIESVLAQGYRNWEYIILDNASTDDTGAIAERYANKDQRIRVIHNRSLLPIIQNWNAAIHSISAGSMYCKVIHADDLLLPGCLEAMVQLAEEHPDVGIVGSYRLYRNTMFGGGLEYPRTVFSGKEICARSLLDRSFYVFGSPTTTLVRSSIIHGVDKFYNENVFHADSDACYRYLQDWNFGFIHQGLTFSRFHSEQQTAFAIRYFTEEISYITLVIEFGKVYLSEQQYAQRVRQVLNDYYHATADRFLGVGPYKLGDKKGYIKWHDKELRRVGYFFDRRRLFLAILRNLLGYAVNPGRTVKMMLSR